MSVVSGVTLLCSLEGCGEEYDEDGIRILSRLNWYLEALGSASHFEELSEHYGGGKHPQQFVFGAGVNYLDEDRFAEFVLSLPWEDPENVVLVIQPEDGPTRVWRAA